MIETQFTSAIKKYFSNVRFDLVLYSTPPITLVGAIINSSSKVGNGCVINTGATVDHDNVLEDYVHVSVGSHLAGTVSIGVSTWIGAGTIINNNISICEECMVGAGAVVVAGAVLMLAASTTSKVIS